MATSRKQAGDFSFHELDHLNPSDAKDLFVRFCEKKTKGNLSTQNSLLENPALERILAKIDYHTLTIEIIAKIYNNSRTLSLESLEQQLAQAVLNTKLSQTAYTHYTQKETTLLETLLAAFDISGLSQQTNALDILAQWAILPATPIPFEHLIALFGITEENENEFDTALTFLIENAWIQQAKETENSYACHALIQEAVKLQIANRVRSFSKVPNPILADEFSYAPLIKRLCRLLRVQAGDNPLKKAIWLLCATTILSQLTEETEILATLSNNTATIYQAMGDLPKSLEYGLKSMAINEKILSPEHPNLAASYNNIASTYKAMGDLPKSLEYGLKSMAIIEKILSPKHPNLAQSYGNIAGIYQTMGDLSKALEYRLSSMAICEKILSPDHPDLATSYNNIAGTYRAMGNLPKSLEYGLKDLAICEKILSPDHPDLATSYNNIASTYQAMGDLPKSLEYRLKSMAIREKILSPDHPDLATSYNNIAGTYYYLQDYLQSLAYFQKAILILRKSLPKGHSHTKGTIDSMAVVLRAAIDAGKIAEVREYVVWYVQEIEGKK